MSERGGITISVFMTIPVCTVQVQRYLPPLHDFERLSPSLVLHVIPCNTVDSNFFDMEK